MNLRPTLQTDRLLLRPFVAEDAPSIQTLAGDRLIAATTGVIPHPYPDGEAEAYIKRHNSDDPDRWQVGCAIVIRETNEFIGAIGLRLALDDRCGELGYWIGVPYWKKGYATEASRALVDYGFRELDLNRIEAHHFATNASSGRVLEKLGMTCEGRMRQHVCKWGELMDTVHYAILREEYESPTPIGPDGAHP